MDEFKENKKFQDTVETAKILFWKYGIKRVTVEEICTETPVSKMTFYKFFKNKEVLAEFVLNGVLTAWHNQYRTIMNNETSFSDKIKKVVLLKETAAKDMSGDFIKDIFNNEYTDLQKLLESDRERYRTEFMKDFIKAQKQGEIRKNIKPEFILYLLEDIGNKVKDEKLSGLYSSKQDLFMELTNYFFYGIMNGENQK